MTIKGADFVTQISAYSKEKGMTQTILAAKLGRDRTGWSRRIHSRPEKVTAGDLLIIQKVFGLSTEQLGELVEGVGR